MARSRNQFIDDSLRFPRETMNAVRIFARQKPWRGTREERIEKFRALHKRLCAVYSLSTKLQIVGGDGPTSVYSHYQRRKDTIVLQGRLSVVTYLHLFAYAIDCRGGEVVKWSVNLFKRRFPISFSRCRFVGHLLVRKTETGNYRPGIGGVDYTGAGDDRPFGHVNPDGSLF
jgi:hypothetical protein